MICLCESCNTEIVGDHKELKFKHDKLEECVISLTELLENKPERYQIEDMIKEYLENHRDNYHI